MRDGVLITMPQGPEILPGVTRGVVLEMAGRLGIAVAERPLRRDELDRVQELFLSGTTTEVLAVVRVDDRAVGDGKPGPVTRRLAEEYRRAVAEASL